MNDACPPPEQSVAVCATEWGGWEREFAINLKPIVLYLLARGKSESCGDNGALLPGQL